MTLKLSGHVAVFNSTWVKKQGGIKIRAWRKDCIKLKIMERGKRKETPEQILRW